MSEQPESSESTLALTLQRRLNLLCDQFEAAWQQGQRPRLEDALAGTPAPEQPAFLREMLRLEIAYRWQHGDYPTADEYLARFPTLDPIWLSREIAAPPDSSQATAGARVPAANRIRCLHCHQPLDLAAEQADEVRCPGCGSSFQVRDARGPDTGCARRLGKFELLQRVGVGAFGAVWRARDTELQRLVALKIPHVRLLAALDELERFHRDARAAAHLRHPGIVTIHEVVVLDGLPTLVSEFIDGVSLKDLLAERRLTFREAAALLAAVADALDYAHTMGVVHRDIKPANIMIANPRPASAAGQETTATESDEELSRVGQPRLVDFGLALRDEVEITLTLDGHILGTPAYMSPEQAAGRSHQADSRSDVYSLGVVLYELLCGEQPFRGSKQMLLAQVQHEEPRPPRRINDQVPRDLETICLKCLHKQPGQRYASARDLAADLRRFLAGEPIQARPVGRLERLGRWCRRNPALAWTGGLAIAALLVTVLTLAALVVMIEDSRATAVKLAEDNDRRRLQAERDAAYRLYEESLAKCEAQGAYVGLHWLARSLQRAHAIGDEPLEQEIRAQLGHWADDLYPLQAVLKHPDGAHIAAISPDGQVLLTRGRDGQVRKWQTATGAQLGPALCKLKSAIYGVVIHPRMKWFATVSKRPARAQVWDWHTGEPRKGLDMNGEGACLALSPDGDILVATADEGDKSYLYRWRTDTFTQLGKPIPYQPQISAVTFSPDGASFWTGDALGQVQRWYTQTGQPLGKPLPHGNLEVTALACSRDGRRLVVGSHDRTAKVWDTETGKSIDQLPQHFRQVWDVAFFAADKTEAVESLVITCCADSYVRFWNWRTGAQAGPALPQFGAARTLTVAPDGSYLAVTGQFANRTWQARRSQHPSRVFVHDDERVDSVSFSPDGARVLTTIHDKAVYLWQAETGTRLAVHRLGKGAMARFSRDGKYLLTAGLNQPVQLWDAATGKQPGAMLPLPRQHLSPPSIPGRRVVDADFFPDRTAILVSYHGRSPPRLWNWISGESKELTKLPSDLGDLDFHPQQPLAALDIGRAVVLWDFRSGKQLGATMTYHDLITACRFSPDGKTLLIGSHDMTARCWDVATGQPRGPMLKHPSSVPSVAFNHDGTLFATACHDGTARFWVPGKRRPLGPPLRHSNMVSAVAFHPRKNLLLTSSYDYQARLWPVPEAVQGDVEQVTRWVQRITGLKLDDNDAVQVLGAKEWQRLKNR